MKPKPDYFTLAVAVGLFLLLTAVKALSATTYYVDVTSGSDTNAGTATNTAWLHLPGTTGFTGSGWAVITNGDTVYVKGGTTNPVSVGFTATWWGGASAFNSILVQSGHLRSPAWGSSYAVFDEGNTNTFGLGFNGVSGITVDGFEVRNVAAGNSAWGGNGSAGIELGAASGFSYVAIKRCYIHDCVRAAADQGHGVEADHGDHLLFYYNRVGPNIGTKGIEPFHVIYGAITNNVIGDAGDHLVALTVCTNLDVANNLLIPGHYGGLDPAYCIAVSKAYNCDVWNNIMFQDPLIWGGNGHMGIGLYNPLDGSVNTGSRFVHNTLALLKAPFNAGADTPVVFGGVGYGPVTNITLVNNLVSHCTNAVGPCGLAYYSIDATNNTIRYNDFWQAYAADTLTYRYTASGASYYTVANFPPDSGTTYSNNQQVDPVLEGGTLPTELTSGWIPNTTYFRLTVSSPSVVTLTSNAVYGGPGLGFDTNANKFAYDIEGTPRTLWSMGAVEFQGVPQAPPGLTALATNSLVTVTWGVPTGGSTPVSGYKLYRGTASGGETLLLATNGTASADSDVTNGVTYWYQVSATNSVGESVRSQEVSATPFAPAAPSAPRSLAAVAGSTYVALSWVAPLNDYGSSVTNYEVLRATSSGAEAHLAYSGTTSYTDSAVVAGTRYYYTVKAVNGIGPGTASVEVSGVPTVTVVKLAGKTTARGKLKLQ